MRDVREAAGLASAVTLVLVALGCAVAVFLVPDTTSWLGCLIGLACAMLLTSASIQVLAVGDGPSCLRAASAGCIALALSLTIGLDVMAYLDMTFVALCAPAYMLRPNDRVFHPLRQAS